jgi:hypothetical protein
MIREISMAKSKKPAARKAAGAAPDEQFTWGNTLPCVATYNILESDRFLDQFEDASVPFAGAGTITIGTLRFFPHVTDDSGILSLLADQMARKFLVLVQKTFTIKKHDPNEDNSDIIDAVAGVFGDQDKTLTELARVLNQQFDFPPGGGGGQ